jgi:hypothetical protein
MRTRWRTRSGVPERWGRGTPTQLAKSGATLDIDEGVAGIGARAQMLIGDARVERCHTRPSSRARQRSGPRVRKERKRTETAGRVPEVVVTPDQLR